MKKSIYFFFILIIFSITFYSCGKDDGPASKLIGWISVYDQFANSLVNKSGVTVSLEGTHPLLSAITDEDGRYQIDNIPAGTYDIVLSKDGYGTYKTFGRVFYGGEKPQNFNGTIRECGSGAVTSLAITYNSTNNTLTFSFVLIPAGTASQPTGYRIFLGNSTSVSPSNYIRTILLSTSSTTLSYTTGIDQTQFPNGSTIYAIVYGTARYDNSYPDYETGLLVYPCLNLNGGSNVASVVIPN